MSRESWKEWFDSRGIPGRILKAEASVLYRFRLIEAAAALAALRVVADHNLPYPLTLAGLVIISHALGGSALKAMVEADKLRPSTPTRTHN